MSGGKFFGCSYIDDGGGILQFLVERLYVNTVFFGDLEENLSLCRRAFMLAGKNTKKNNHDIREKTMVSAYGGF